MQDIDAFAQQQLAQRHDMAQREHGFDADRALQIHGGLGVMRNTEINKLFQIARNLRIPGGTDEVQRTTIAETLGLRFEASKSVPQGVAEVKR